MIETTARALIAGLIRAGVESDNVDANEIAGFAEAIILLDEPKWIVVDVFPGALLAVAKADRNFTAKNWTEENDKRAGFYAAFFKDKTPPPVVVNLLPDGRLSILDGRHRLVSYKHKQAQIPLAMPERFVGDIMLKLDLARSGVQPVVVPATSRKDELP